MRHYSKKLIPTISCLFIAVTIMAQQKTEPPDWQQFRGPNGSGISKTTGLPKEFGPEQNVIWKTALPTGHSSPILTEDYIFLTALEEEKLMTICLDRRNGEIIWRKDAPRPRKEKIDNRNHPASPSPVTNGKQVYVFFPEFGLLAYNLKGKELWQLPLGPFNNAYGMGTSPILVENKLILVCDQNKSSFIIAVDKDNGRLIWRKARPEAKSGHSTPIVYKPEGGETQIIVPGSFFLMSYSAKTGEKLWWVSGLCFEMKSTPVIHKNILYINGYGSPLNQPENQVEVPSFKEALTKHDKNKNGLLSKDELPEEPAKSWIDFVDLGYDGQLDAEDWSYFQAALASLNGMLAIRLGGQGDMSASNLLWQYRRSVPQLPSPLIYQNVLYMLNDGGIMTAFKPESGEVINKGRIRGAGSHFYASPVAADDKVFIISLRGKVSVLSPDGNLELMASSDLKEKCYATPAFAPGKIYIRTEKTLYCFGRKD